MYTALLVFHSLFRWFLLLSLVFAIYKAYSGWFSGKAFAKSDNTLRIVTSSLAHVQLLIGIGLFFVSPLIEYFLNNFGDAVKQSEVRFFGMEHNLMMLLAIVFITIGSASSKRKPTDVQKFKTIAIWFTIALIIILVAIPWPFSPMASRPYFRGF